jgi:hypothetical protein
MKFQATEFVPPRGNKEPIIGSYAKLLKEFVDSGMEVAVSTEEFPSTRSAGDTRKGLNHTATKYGLPVKAVTRGKNIYLTRTDK